MSDQQAAQRTAEHVIGELWPYDGPMSPEQSIAAAEAIEQLTRYLAHALNPVNRSNAVPLDGTFATVLRSLGGSAANLLQLLDNLRLHVEAAGNLGEVVDDRGYPPAESADTIAADIMSARAGLHPLNRNLNSAAAHASHLELTRKKTSS